MGNTQCESTFIDNDNNKVIDPNSSLITKQQSIQQMSSSSFMPTTKCEFVRIKPVKLMESNVQNDGEGKRKSIRVKKQAKGQENCELEKIIEEQKDCGVKVPVNWSSFIKIKKKNYLDEYINIKEIGSGAYGTIFKVKTKYSGLFRAAKVVRIDQISKKESRLKFISEITIPMKTDHPNLNKLFEVFQWKNHYTLIMDLCDGGDLFQRIRLQKTFHQSKVSEIIRHILSGVAYLHSQNIVHRDLKPQNMLYDNEGKLIKITDFGTAIQLSPGKTLSELAGSSFYIAPEVLEGNYNEKCDIWSCGVILYILLCGTPPFYGNREEEIFKKIKKGDLKFEGMIWSKRSKECKQLIGEMLRKNYEKRPSANKLLSNEWIKDSEKFENQECGSELVNNISDFRFKNKLKAVVYTYIASQLYSNKDKEKLLAFFKEVDKDGNGVIGKSELIEVFQKHRGQNFSEIQAEKIIDRVDINGSGKIDFTQFLVAASNEEQLLQKKKLENAFAYLDHDHSGYITADQILPFLENTSETEQELKKIFSDVDENGDGKISKKEFISLLLKKN